MRYRSLSLIFFIAFGLSVASPGDRSHFFHVCLQECEQEQCLSFDRSTVDLALRLTRWTCMDECKYTCMHVITDQAIVNHQPIQQYYGKWPFWRFAGMQEPASVLFSLLNLAAHVTGFQSARRKIPQNHSARSYYLAWGLVNMNAWVWSAVFHTRDTTQTEKLDYFSAGLAILYSLFYTVVRLFNLYNVFPSSPTIPLPQILKFHVLSLWAGLCTILYILHVSYLAIPLRFNYTYNMTANVIVGFLHNLLWICYSIPFAVIRPFPLRPPDYRPAFAYKPVIFALLTTAATCLELFDFPPWRRIIDAHALWHLSTAPIILFWWTFLVQDALDEGWKTGKT